MKESSVYCKIPSVGPSKENKQIMVKIPELLDGFQARVFEDSKRKRV